VLIRLFNKNYRIIFWLSSKISPPLARFYINTISLASLLLLLLLTVGAPAAPAAAKIVSSSASDEIHNIAILHEGNSGGREGGYQNSNIATESGEAVTQSSESAVTQSGNERTVNTLPLPSGVGPQTEILGIKDNTTLLNILLSNSIMNAANSSAAGSSPSSGNTKCLISVLRGGTSNITINGNLIIGTDCDDIISGENEDEIIFTLAGNDEANGGNGNDIIYAGSGEDRLYGERGNDMLVAGLGADLLDGGPGDDIIVGGHGNDLLIGGTGNDVIMAGSGTSIMYGGHNADKFDCGSVSGTIASSAAIVMDYNPSEGDTITGKCKLVNTNTDNSNSPSSSAALLSLGG
jgi:Ca2+-binding RTX toxin-like protein